MLFYKHILRSIQGHSFVAFVVPGKRVSWTVLIICLAVSSAVLLGFGWQGGSSSHKFYPPSDASGFLPGVFSFTICLFQQLEYFLSVASQPCLICTHLRSVRFSRTLSSVGPRSDLECFPFFFLFPTFF